MGDRGKKIPLPPIFSLGELNYWKVMGVYEKIMLQCPSTVALSHITRNLIFVTLVH